MAKIVQAVNHYGPRLELNSTAQLDQISDWMEMRTGLNKSEIMMVLQETSEAILYFTSQGTPLKLPGVGTFTPSINRAGKLKTNFRPDKVQKQSLNAPGVYQGNIRNKDKINLDDQGYKELWDADHPDNPLEI